MKPAPFRLVIGLALIVSISAASSFLTLRVVSNSPSLKAEDYHDWIHKKLKMSPEQEQLSQISERRYEETKRHLEQVIQLANRELAEKILKDKSYSPSVEKSVAEIHNAMGQLQEATLEHIFELRSVLDPPQYERLIELTVQGLSQNSGQN